jgi:hypothetical protein
MLNAFIILCAVVNMVLAFMNLASYRKYSKARDEYVTKLIVIDGYIKADPIRAADIEGILERI